MIASASWRGSGMSCTLARLASLGVAVSPRTAHEPKLLERSPFMGKVGPLVVLMQGRAEWVWLFTGFYGDSSIVNWMNTRGTVGRRRRGATARWLLAAAALAVGPSGIFSSCAPSKGFRCGEALRSDENVVQRCT